MAWTRVGVALGAVGFLACAAAALAKPQMAVPGTYSGEYTCTQGLTGMTLELRPSGAGKVQALIVFYEHPANPGIEAGCFLANGTYDSTTGKVALDPDRWLFQPSPYWEMTRMEGAIAGASFTGRIVARTGPSGCTTFALARNAEPFKPAPKECIMPQAIS